MTSYTNLSVAAGLSDVFVRMCGIPQILLTVDRFLVLMTLVGKLAHVDELTN
jgi:hypothetical protein